jgi:hypothetical protein
VLFGGDWLGLVFRNVFGFSLILWSFGNKGVSALAMAKARDPTRPEWLSQVAASPAPSTYGNFISSRGLPVLTTNALNARPRREQAGLITRCPHAP